MAPGGCYSALSGATNALGGAQSKRTQEHFASYNLAPPQQSGNTFTTVADAYVAGDATTTNYGTATTLRADASPDLNSYLRFDVQGLTGSVTSATLRIYANSASSTGYTLYAVTDNTWTETGITYSNAPAMAPNLAPRVREAPTAGPLLM